MDEPESYPLRRTDPPGAFARVESASMTSEDPAIQTDRMGHRWLRAEGAAVAIAAIVLYAEIEASWWLFALLFLVPDVFMVGYLRGPRWGARIYNAGHIYAGPLLLAALGWITGAPYALEVGLVWIAHIGADRAFGYGLKLPGGFDQTHLGRIGKARKSTGR